MNHVSLSRCYGVLLGCFLACQLVFNEFLFTESAHAAPVAIELDFIGSAPNSLDLELTATGSTTTSLNGKFVKFFTGSPEPQTDPLILSPATYGDSAAPAHLSANFLGGPETTRLMFDSTTWTPISIEDLNIDLLNGVQPVFGLDQIVLEVVSDPPGFFIPSDIRFDIAGSIPALYFFQEPGLALFGPANSYAIPGTLVGYLDFDVNVDMFGGSLFLSTALGPTQFQIPFTLNGQLDVHPSGSNPTEFVFDGTNTSRFPIHELSTIFSVDSFGVAANVTFDLVGGLDLQLDYHLQDTAHVPEPGTIVLFGLGLASLAPLAWRRLVRR